MSLPLHQLSQANQGQFPPLTPSKPEKPRARSAPPRTRVKHRSIQLESFPKPSTLPRHKALAQEDLSQSIATLEPSRAWMRLLKNYF